MADVGKEKIAIVGSGLIGRSWAMLFAGAGYRVEIYDIDQALVTAALKDVEKQLTHLEETGMLRGKLTAKQQIQLITGSVSLPECVSGATLVQECVPERLDIKRDVFKKIDAAVDDSTILSSSTSTFQPSLFSEELKNRNRVVVSHPVNPPYFVPLVEIVPAPWTDAAVLTEVRAIMTRLGQAPVVLSREVPGFALNRIQYCILNEVWRLVEDGILDTADIDTVMSEGLGMRYAFMGPLETAHLNAEGMGSYCERYSKTIFDVSNTMGPVPKMEGPVAAQVTAELCQRVPIEKLEERRRWRDACLTKLAKLKSEMKQ